LRPIFPVWLAQENRSPPYLRKTCDICRGFLTWAKAHWSRYDSLDPDFIASLRPPRGQDQVRERLIYDIEEVRRLVLQRPRNLTEEREMAATAFLFLSGMRIGAFCTLPIAAVDLNTRSGRIKQWPSLGVHTKNGKAANTYLLPIADLRQVVRLWDTKIREHLPPSAPWYALIDNCGREFALHQRPGNHRPSGYNKRLRQLCERTGINYRSAHKLRHGFAVWALKRVHTMDEYKAVSENMMHSTMQITDSTYARLVDGDVASVISKLDPNRAQDDLVQELARLLLAALNPDEENPAQNLQRTLSALITEEI